MVEIAGVEPSPQAGFGPIVSTLAPVSSPPGVATPSLESSVRLIALATDLVDKQYRLYSWNDSKALSLITTNSLLFAAVGFLFKECLTDLLALLCISTAFVFLGTSLIFSLKQVIPQGSSGKSGDTPNLRSLRGILGFPDAAGYHAAFCALSEDKILEDATRQVYGMAHNNDESRKITTKGVRITFAGIAFILAAAAFSALSARDINLLGKWAPDKTQFIRVLPPEKSVSNAVQPPAPSIQSAIPDAHTTQPINQSEVSKR